MHSSYPLMHQIVDILNLTARLIFQVHPYQSICSLHWSSQPEVLHVVVFFYALFILVPLSFFGFIAIAAPVDNCD